MAAYDVSTLLWLGKEKEFDGLLEDYDDKFLLTGFDTNGKLLEIMYNFVNENTVYVFHAMECRKVFRMLRNQY